MTRFTPAPSSDRLQYAVFAALSLAAAGATGILYLYQVPYLRPYFGSINPLLAIAVVAVLGSISLWFLHSRNWFELYTPKETLRGAALSAVLATMFAIAVISVDLTVGFPRDLNVPAPWSLFFYPAMAYVAEICFHAVPLALLLAVLGKLFKTMAPDLLVWICILPASLLEPIFQLEAGYSTGKSFSWLAAYVGLQVFAINLLQLYVFLRYGFVAMYSFRLAYYIHWHIVWGFLRLKVLF